MYALVCAACLFGDTPSRLEGYVFVPDTERFVAIHQGAVLSIGKLDKRGTFTPDPKWVDLKDLPQSLPFRVDVINPRHDRPQLTPVYEFRSERLIPGQLNEEGRFLPEVGGQIIAFKDYRYAPGKSRPIYNLPGRFEKRK